MLILSGLKKTQTTNNKEQQQKNNPKTRTKTKKTPKLTSMFIFPLIFCYFQTVGIFSQLNILLMF